MLLNRMAIVRSEILSSQKSQSRHRRPAPGQLCATDLTYIVAQRCFLLGRKKMPVLTHLATAPIAIGPRRLLGQVDIRDTATLPFPCYNRPQAVGIWQRGSEHQKL